MITHVVMWNLHDPEDAPRFRDLLLTCCDLVPGQLEYRVGIRQADLAASCDVALVSRFHDQAALAAYLTHPTHVSVSDQLAPLRSERHVLDYVGC